MNFAGGFGILKLLKSADKTVLHALLNNFADQKEGIGTANFGLAAVLWGATNP